MSFTITDFSDLKRLLLDHPEWRAELRELILTDELVDLPRVFAESRASYEARFERIERALVELAQAQTRTEQRVQELAEAIRQLTAQQKIFGDRQSEMLGKFLERDYADDADAFFGDFVRRIRVLIPGRLDADTENALHTHLDKNERRDATRIDVLLIGKLHESATPQAEEVYCAVEVSAVIDRTDVERAQRRADLFRKAGLRTVPIVAGEGMTRGARELLDDLPVAVVQDGSNDGWERALATALQA